MVTVDPKSATKMSKSTDWSQGDGWLPGRANLGPLFLMLTTPCFSIIFFHVCSHNHGDFQQFLLETLADERPFLIQLKSIWPNPYDPLTLKMIGCFALFQLFLMKAAPGKPFTATITPNGHRPVYKANGMQSYLITLATMMALDYWNIFDLALIYDNFGHILSSMNVFALAFCTLLLIKGYVAPSGPDSGTNGSLLIDFYWGTELYPRIAGFDVKLFTNCRMGMAFWSVAVLSFCYKNMQLNNGTLQAGLAVSVCLQLVYITKFFYWEMGYMCSMDIQHDRAGYYICWGCLVWVPAVYTSAAFYLTESAPELSNGAAASILAAGWLCIAINYESDQQRYIFRQTGGKCKIWGKEPTFITAKYKTTSGAVKESLLLVDGWWKISRHFHYVPEIMASFFWSVSALDSGFVGPYFYVVFLTILLTDRAFRDDNRCKAKYGKYWKKYSDEVPYKILPGVV